MVSGLLPTALALTITFSTAVQAYSFTPLRGGSRSSHNDRAHHVEHAKRAFPSGWPTTSRCLVDSTTARVLSTRVSTSNTLTTDICVALCNTGKYKYAGVEYGKECWCGNTLPSAANQKTSTACTMPCGGNKNQICGGGNAIRLFTKSATVVSSSIKRTTTTSSRKPTSTSSRRTTTSSRRTTTTSSRRTTTSSSRRTTTTSSSRRSSTTSSVRSTSSTRSSSLVLTLTSSSRPTSSPSSTVASTSSSSSSSSTTSSAASQQTVYTNPDYLFPKPITDGWSVANFENGETVDNLRPLTLTSSTLVIKKDATGSTHPIVDAHGKTSMLAHMTEGSLTPGKAPYGGFSFYTFGPPGSSNTVPLVDFKSALEMTFSYSIFFQPDFNFNLGGKLPGLYGGVTEEVAVTCSGGSHDPGCFSARLMFRGQGAGELYLYIPQETNNNDSTCGTNGDEVCLGDKTCGTNGDEYCGTTYGNSAGRGNWFWKPGQWQTVTQRILLNTPGVADGEAEIYVDGVSVLKVKKVTWRTDPTSVIRGAQMQIFFGGHTDPWRCPKDQDVFFADLSAGIIQ